MSHRWSLLFVLGLSASLATAEVFVSPAGSDAWSGSLSAPNAAGNDGPKATLAGALTTARQTKQGAAGYTITLREGTWYLPATVQLGPDDSGTADQPTRLRAYPDEHPRLVGGRRIQVFEPDAGPVYRADLKQLGLGGVAFRQLFCNGERLPLARYPNVDPADPLHAGYLYVEAPATEGSKRSFRYHEGDLPEWRQPEGADVFFWHSHNYYNTIVKLKSVDRATRAIELDRDTYGAIVGNDAERYYLENLREALDAPGEWYLDREQSVLYLYPPEKSAESVIEVPTIDRAIALGEGTHDVVIEGLTIEVARTHGVRMDGTERCTVAKCVIGHTGASPEIGGWGPWEDCAGVGIFGGHHNRVIGCDISDVGSHGVKLRGGDHETLEPSDNAAENCVIHHTGVIWKQGCGVRMEGVGNRFSRNLVHHCPRFAVIFGGNNQVIELNHLHTLNLETCDTGATYTGGRDGLSPRGSIQRFNYIHDIGGYGRENGKWASPVFSWGIYLDDLASGVEVYGNIVVGARRGGIHVHNGRDNTLENNLLLDGINQQIEFNGWPNTANVWTSRQTQIEQNWEKYRQNPAWSTKYPKLFAQPPSEWVQMAGNRVLRNILAWHEPNAWLYRWRNLPLEATEFDSNLVWHDDQPIPTGYTTVTNEVGANLCPNAGFEDGQPGAVPPEWGFYAKPTPQARIASSDHEPASGKLCLEVTCSNNPDPKAQFRYVMIKTGNLPVQSGKQYHLTVKLRGDRDGLPANLVLQSFRAGQHHWAAEKGHRLTTAWQTYDLAARIPGPGEPGYKPTLSDLYIRLDCSAPEGTVWVDDVTLREAELGDEWKGWQATGHDVRSRVADPLFVDRNGGDLRLQPNSPALQLGFKPLPYNRIGPYQDPLRATWPVADNELAWH